ncbi:MAG: SLC13 family permease [Rhodospirillaceae bacterium]
MSNLKAVLAGIVVLAAVTLCFAPPPDGMTADMMRSFGLIVFTVGFWAVGALPEHLTGLLFFLVAMVFAIAPAQVVFSGFESATLWLVLGGLIMAEAVNRTGLAQRLAVLIFDRYADSYRHLVLAVVLAAIGLSFVMPATVGRVLLLVPIVVAAAERAGFPYGSAGYEGLCIAALMATYQCGTGILPANAPNLVLAGAAETLYAAPMHYAEYLWMQFPVMGLVKGALIVVFVWWLFPATARRAAHSRELPPLTREQQRLALILGGALLLWATDFAHGVKAGWIALAAGLCCVLPRIGVMSYAAFNEVRFGAYFYVAATLGVGVLTQKSGLSAALGRGVDSMLDLQRGADFANFVSLSIFTTLAGLFTTNPAQPAVLAPLAQGFADATGWPLKTALFTLAVGFSTMLLPHQVPPVVVGMQATRLRLASILRVSLPLAFVSLLTLLPLQYYWWRLIGAFG